MDCIKCQKKNLLTHNLKRTYNTHEIARFHKTGVCPNCRRKESKLKCKKLIKKCKKCSGYRKKWIETSDKLQAQRVKNSNLQRQILKLKPKPKPVYRMELCLEQIKGIPNLNEVLDGVRYRVLTRLSYYKRASDDFTDGFEI